jgi:hypothetical protein
MTTPRAVSVSAALPARESEPRESPLSLVAGRVSEAARARRTRLLTTLLSLAAAVGMFAIVCLHVVLSQGQVNLDRMQDRAAVLQSQNENLRLAVAALESPNRVVITARTLMGMVPPETVIPLAPVSPPSTTPR